MPLNFDAFCDHAAHGRLADVQRMLESGELYANENLNDNLNDTLVLAAQNGHVDVVDYLLRQPLFDPSAYGNCAIWVAAMKGHLAVVERLLQDKRVDPSADDNHAVRRAAENGHLAVVERLLQDKRVDPSVRDNCAVRCDWLLRKVNSPSSIGCSRMTASTLLSRFSPRFPNTANDSSAANA
jgi:ankyrin repeat protein